MHLFSIESMATDKISCAALRTYDDE